MTDDQRTIARLTVVLDITNQILDDLLRREIQRHGEAFEGPWADAGPVAAPEPRRWLKRRT